MVHMDLDFVVFASLLFPTACFLFVIIGNPVFFALVVVLPVFF